MATQEQKQNDITAAQQDLEFIQHHPVQGATIVAGAAASGVVSAVETKLDSLAEAAKATIQPGDMHIKNAPHPIDNLVANSHHLAAGLSKLTAPGDMNLANSPHPRDQLVADATQKAEAVQKAGIIQGTEMASAMLAGMVIDGADPLKKVEVATDIAKAVSIIPETHAGSVLQGELVDDIPVGKNVAISPTVSPAPSVASTLRDLKSAAINQVPGPIRDVLKDVFDPSLSDRIIRQSYKERPGILDITDERHLIGGDEKALHAQHADQVKRAQLLAAEVEQHPALMAANNRITDAQISALINNSSNDHQLGLPHNPESTRRLPSPDEQVRIDAHNHKIASAQQALADEKAHQESLSPVQRWTRQIQLDNTSNHGAFAWWNRYGLSKSDEMKMAASEKDSTVLLGIVKNNARGLLQTAGLAGTGVAIALGTSSNEYEKQAATFKKNAQGPDLPGHPPALERNLTTGPTADRDDWSTVISGFRGAQQELRNHGGGETAFKMGNDKLIENFAAAIEEKGVHKFSEQLRAHTLQASQDQAAAPTY